MVFLGAIKVTILVRNILHCPLHPIILKIFFMKTRNCWQKKKLNEFQFGSTTSWDLNQKILFKIETKTCYMCVSYCTKLSIILRYFHNLNLYLIAIVIVAHDLFLEKLKPFYKANYLIFLTLVLVSFSSLAMKLDLISQLSSKSVVGLQHMRIT